MDDPRSTPCLIDMDALAADRRPTKGFWARGKDLARLSAIGIRRLLALEPDDDQTAVACTRGLVIGAFTGPVVLTEASPKE